MSDLISTLITQTGLPSGLAEKGLGAILGFLKEKLPPELFSKVEGSVPQAGGAITAYHDGEESAGLMAKAGGLVGGLLGSKAGDLSKLFEMLSSAGLSLDQAKVFLPKVLEALKGVLPADVLKQIMDHLPGLGAELQQAGT